jgi:predicted metalloprotease with PDZ domain
LPYANLLSKFGLDLTLHPAKTHQDGGKYHLSNIVDTEIHSLDIGAKLEKQALGYIVKNVYDDTPAQKSGLAVNDLLIAINGVKLNNLDKQLAFLQENEVVNLSVFRQDRLLSIELTLHKCSVKLHHLQLLDKELLANWL